MGKTVRKPRIGGVRPAAQAFCDRCGWHGGAWHGQGAFKNAAGEYRMHLARCHKMEKPAQVMQ